MRILVFFLLGANWLWAGQAGGTGSVSGTVYRASTGTPFVSATVVLTTRVLEGPMVGGSNTPVRNLLCPPAGIWVPPPPPPTPLPPPPPPAGTVLRPSGDRQIATDASGNFSFEQVPPGTYRLYAVAEGHLREENLQTDLYSAGTPIEIKAGSRISGITFSLQRAPSVSGRVTRPNGEAAVNFPIRLLRLMFDGYGERPVPSFIGATDDRGVFRISGVIPGRYYLMAGCSSTPLDAQLKDDPVYQIAWTYYPGGVEQAGARLLEAEPEKDLEGLNFSLETRSRVYSLRGSTELPAYRAMNLTELWTGVSTSHAVDPGTGRFEAHGLDAGLYIVRLTAGGAWAAFVRVPSESSEELLLLPNGTPVSGQVLVEGSDSLPADLRVRILFSPLLTSGMRELISPIDRDGVFNARLQPGEFRFGLDRAPDNFYLKRAEVAGEDVLDRGFRLLNQPRGPVVLTFSPNGAQIEGSVSDTMGRPRADIQLALVPVQPDRTDLYRAVKSAADGHFLLRGIPPGTYRLFAWESIPQFGYYSSYWHERAENEALSLDITESSRHTIDVRIKN